MLFLNTVSSPSKYIICRFGFTFNFSSNILGNFFDEINKSLEFDSKLDLLIYSELNFLPKKYSIPISVFSTLKRMKFIQFFKQYYLLRKNNFKVIYLGINTPYESLKDIDSSLFEAIVTFFIVSEENTKVSDFLNQMSADFPDKKIFFASNENLLGNEKLSGSLIRLYSPMDLIKLSK